MPRHSAIFDPMMAQVAVFKCTQSSTAAPAIGSTVVNGIAALTSNPVITRTSAGLYPFTLTGAFPAGKTVVTITSSKATAVIPAVIYTSADVCTLSFFDAATPTAADSGDFDLKIEIYP